MIYERRGERSFVFGALDFTVTLVVFVAFDTLYILNLRCACSATIDKKDFAGRQFKT